MSADGKTNHDMTNSDIALLLADAADEVEIGIAPYDAVVRGGRRRRARRWAVAAATALVLAGSSATLAVAGLPGGDGGRVAPLATQPPTAEERHVYEPQRTMVARGFDGGKEWRVAVEVWGAPRDKVEAVGQLGAMTKSGLEPAEVHKPADLVGKTSFFVTRAYGGGRPQQVMFDTVEKLEPFSGKDLQTVATRLGSGPESSDRLVIGEVAQTAQQVKCTWRNGMSRAELPGAADGLPVKWFVCVVPEGTTYKDAEVIQ